MNEGQEMPILTPKKRKRWLGALLLGSLILNVGLMGLLVTVVNKTVPPFPPRPDMVLELMASKLDEADRKIFLGTYETYRPRLNEGTKAMMDHLKALKGYLGAEPFDVETIRAHHNRVRITKAEIDQAVGEFLIAVTPLISAEGRRKLASFPPDP